MPDSCCVMSGCNTKAMKQNFNRQKKFQHGIKSITQTTCWVFKKISTLHLVMPAGELKPPFVLQFSIFLDYLLQQPVEDPNTLLIWMCSFFNRLTLLYMLHLSHKVKFLNSPPGEYLTPLITTNVNAI